jgi:elongation factor Ts
MRLTKNFRSFQKFEAPTTIILRKCSVPSEGKSFIELVKILRKETQAGVVDCRDALIAGGNDIQKAKDWLFDQAKITAAKKSGRKAQEGCVAVWIEDSIGAMVEINSETDFVAKEKTFVESCEAISRALRANYEHIQNKKSPNLASILELPLKTTISGFETNQVKDVFQQLTFLYKENIVLRRACLFPQEANFDPSKVHLFKYIHTALTPNLGKIGCVVQLETASALDESQKKELQKLGSIIATQVVGGKPYSIEGKERLESVDDAEMCHESDFEPSMLKQVSVLESMFKNNRLEQRGERKKERERGDGEVKKIVIYIFRW